MYRRSGLALDVSENMTARSTIDAFSGTEKPKIAVPPANTVLAVATPASSSCV
jgi:hypothetical protein